MADLIIPDVPVNLEFGLNNFLRSVRTALFTVADSTPLFANVKLSDLTDGYIPYHVSDSVGLANSPLFVASTVSLTSVASIGITKADAYALTLLSGNSAKWTGFSMGRASADADAGIVHTTNSWMSGTAAGDLALRCFSHHFWISLDTGTTAHYRFDTSGDLYVLTGTVICSDLTNGVVPYNIGSQGLKNTEMSYSAGNFGIGGADKEAPLCIYKSPSATAGSGVLGFAYNTGTQGNLWMFRVLTTSYDLAIDGRVGGTWARKYLFERATPILNIGVDDTDKGYLRLFGDTASGGGEIQLFSGATSDSVIDYWRVTNSGGAFYVLSDSLLGGATYAMSVSTAGAVTLAYTDGHVNVGQAHTTKGILSLNGDTGNGGGEIILYNGDTADGTVDYWRVYASAGAFAIAGTSGPTGLTVATDGNVGIAQTSGIAYVGTHDSIRGQFVLCGDASAVGNHTGGSLLVYTAGYYDTNTEYFSVFTYDDVLVLSSQYGSGLQVNRHQNVGIASSGLSNSKLTIVGLGTSSSNYGFFHYDSGLTIVFYTRDDGYGYLQDSPWNFSDGDSKENIVNMSKTGSVDKIRALKPVKFDRINGRKNQLGFIAQDVESIIPEAVQLAVVGKIPVEGKKLEECEDRYGLTMNYTYILPHLVSAIQEMSDEANVLRSEIATMKNEIDSLKTKH